MGYFFHRVGVVVADAEDENVDLCEERAILLSEFEICFKLANRDENRGSPENNDAGRLDQLVRRVTLRSTGDFCEHSVLAGRLCPNDCDGNRGLGLHWSASERNAVHILICKARTKVVFSSPKLFRLD